MKLYRNFKAGLAALAIAGTILPANLVEAAQPQQKAQAAKAASLIRDARLTEDGIFRGQVSDAKQKPVANAVVSVRQARKEIVRTKTDARGVFEVTNLKPGVYYVVAGTSHGVYRVWSHRTAPPKALASVKMVSDMSIVRAQGQVLYDDSGQAYGQVRIVDNGGLVPVGPNTMFGPGGSFIDSIGLYDLTVLGLAGGGLGVGIAAYNKAKDAEDAADSTSASP
ncbi:MAG: carboxypeptidase-like regulatory domain-containing protein [Planctomycetota bacterium]